jgi:mycothiol synthase
MSIPHTTPFTSRAYRSDHDLALMLDMLQQARHQTSDWRFLHVGELAWNFFQVAIHLDPHQFIRLWFDTETLVAFAILGEYPSFEVQVLPAYAWQGIEQDALAWAESRITALRRQDSQLWGGTCTTFARQDDPARQSFLEHHGFNEGGGFSEVNMIRSLKEPIPDPLIPAGFQVRPLSATGELTTRAEVQRQVWQPWSVGICSDADYAYFMTLPPFHRDLDIVAVAPDGSIVSYVNGWIDPLNHVGDIGPLGALEGYRNQGLTRAVIQVCLQTMRGYGMDRVEVSTGIHNTPARNLYQSLGFIPENFNLEYIKA